MLQWFLFGIALASILVLGFLLKTSLRQNSSNMRILSQMTSLQMQTNQTLTNLILSKDPMTFQQLQATPTSNSLANHDEHVNPLDDASVAERLAKQYESLGLDPRNAYAHEDVDIVTEFGLNN